MSSRRFVTTLSLVFCMAAILSLTSIAAEAKTGENVHKNIDGGGNPAPPPTPTASPHSGLPQNPNSSPIPTPTPSPTPIVNLPNPNGSGLPLCQCPYLVDAPEKQQLKGYNRYVAGMGETAFAAQQNQIGIANGNAEKNGCFRFYCPDAHIVKRQAYVQYTNGNQTVINAFTQLGITSATELESYLEVDPQFAERNQSLEKSKCVPWESADQLRIYVAVPTSGNCNVNEKE